MVSISTFISLNLLQKPSNPLTVLKPSVSLHRTVYFDTVSFESCRANPDTSLFFSAQRRNPPGRTSAVAQEAQASVQGETSRRLYVGNIPRNVNNSELATIFGEHGSVEKAEVMYDKYSGRSRRFGFVTMSTVEDASVAIEKLNESEIGGRQIKVNVTEKPLLTLDFSLQAEEFIDSPHKVYVGNLGKSVTTKILNKFFSEKGKVLSAKVSRVPGTSKSSGFGFVSFSSEEDVEAAISSFNNTFLEGQRIRVNKA